MWMPNAGLQVNNLMRLKEDELTKREVCCFFETQSSPHPEDSLDRGVDHHLPLHLPVDSRHLAGCQQYG